MASRKVSRSKTDAEKAATTIQKSEGFELALADEPPASEAAQLSAATTTTDSEAVAARDAAIVLPEVVAPPAPSPRVEQVQLASIETAPELNCRARGVNRTTANEYAEAMQGGAPFPPVVVFRDGKGKLWLADGHHRCAAAALAQRTEIPADVRDGSRRDALLYAARANGSHGLRRTNRDKRRACELVLAAFPNWTDRRVAEACGTSHPFVGKVRAQLVTVTTPEREGADGKVRRGKAFNPERELARLAERIDALVKTWPRQDAEGRAQLAAMLSERATWLTGTSKRTRVSRSRATRKPEAA